MSAAEDFDDGEECWHCGGEGYVHDCIDGCCVDAEEGCEDCTRRCPECALAEHRRLREARIAMLRSLDVDRAIAWAKQAGRWREDMSRIFVLGCMHIERSRCPEFTEQERADSSCWTEGLL